MQLQVLQLNSFHLSPSMAAAGRSLLRRLGVGGGSCILKPKSLVLQREKAAATDVTLMAQRHGDWNTDFRAASRVSLC